MTQLFQGMKITITQTSKEHTYVIAITDEKGIVVHSRDWHGQDARALYHALLSIGLQTG